MVSLQQDWSKRATLAAGVIAIAVGVVVMIGWQIHSVPLVQVFPALAPMQRMTAVGFVLCGVALILAATGQKRATGIFASIVLMLAVTVSLEYLANADFGIDELLGRDYVNVRTSNPGRMSPVVALCFIGSSLALLVTALRRLAGFASAIVGILASVLIAVGMVSVLGYLLGHTETYVWSHFSRMALHTSGGFALLGGGLLAWAWGERRIKQGAPEWLPLSIGMGLAAGVLGVWQAIMARAAGEIAVLSGIILAGGLAGAVLVALATSQTQQAQKRSRESQEGKERLERLFDASPDTLLLTDQQGRIIQTNPRVTATFGYTRDELLGQAVEVLVPEKVRQLHEIHRKHYYARPQTRSMGLDMELYAQRKDGSAFPVEIALSPVHSGSEMQVFTVVRDITERKLAEAALRESEAAFVTLANCVPQLVWMCTPDGLNVYFNQRWVEYTGLTLEESYGRGWITPFHPDDKQAAWDAWNKATATGGTYRVESRLRAADGSYRWFLMRGLPLRDKAGTIVRWFGTCTDIDDLKRAEQKLLESEARLRLQINRMPIACIVFTKELRILSWNPAAEQIFGFSAEEVVGRHAYDCIVPPELQPQIDSVIARLVEGDETAHSTNDNLTKDGRRITCEWTNTPLRGPEGSVYGILSMTQDITARKQAEDALRESEERFRSLFEQGPLGYVLMGMDRRMIKVNAAFCRMLGYSEAELTSMTPLEVTHPEDRAASADLIQRLFGGYPACRIEKRYVKKNGEIIWASLTTSAIHDREGRPLYSVGLIEDITERRRAEAELRLGSEIFANMEEGVCLVRLDDGIIVHANPKFEKMFGYEPEELAGKHVMAINAPTYKHPEETAKEIREELRRSKVWRGEILHQRKDGTPFWCAVTVSAFHHPEFGTVGVSIHQDITDLKKARETLRESEERFRGIFEQGPIGVALLGTDHRMTKSNPAFCRMLGYSEAELARMTPLDMTHPDDRDSCARLLERLDKGEIPVCRMEKRYLKKNGETMWATLTASVVRDQGGKSLYGLGMIEDITERKHAEQKLAEQAALLDLAHDSIAVRDLEGRIVFWNRGAKDTYGWSTEEAMGQVAHELLQTTFPVPREEIEAAVRAQGVWAGELEQTRRDGKRIIVASRWSLWRDEHGAPRAFLIINRDITERKQAERQLAEQAALLDLARDAIIVQTLDARITFWNRGAEDTYGWSAEEVRGRVTHELLQTRFPIPFKEIEAALLTQGQWEGELEHTTRDGTAIVVASSWSLQRDEHGAPSAFLEINRDITARKQMEAQLEASREQMITSARLSALGMMAGGIAHEINNPVGIIHALASDLIDMVNEQGGAPPEMVARNSTRIRETADRIARIIRSMRQISREGSEDTFLPTRIGKIVEETLEICKERFQANAVKLLLPKGVPELSVSCRQVQIEQALLNLLQNAFDAVVGQQEERWVRLDVSALDHSVVISVTDSGPGIPPALRSRIMEPFFTTKAVGKGTGLGLSLSKNIAEKHGGKLEYAEVQGRTRFSLILPLARQAETVWT